MQQKDGMAGVQFQHLQPARRGQQGGCGRLTCLVGEINGQFVTAHAPVAEALRIIVIGHLFGNGNGVRLKIPEHVALIRVGCDAFRHYGCYFPFAEQRTDIAVIVRAACGHNANEQNYNEAYMFHFLANEKEPV